MQDRETFVKRFPRASERIESQDLARTIADAVLSEDIEAMPHGFFKP